MINEFLIVFFAIFLCEFGDKTQLVIFSLSHHTDSYLKILTSVVLATLIADGIAIFLGAALSKFLPLNFLGIFSGVLFILFGLIILLQKEEVEDSKMNMRFSFFASFLLVLSSEMGDKTQVVASVFGGLYNPIFALVAVLIAVVLITLFSLFLGKFLLQLFKKKTLSYVAGALFISMGIFALTNVNWF